MIHATRRNDRRILVDDSRWMEREPQQSVSPPLSLPTVLDVLASVAQRAALVIESRLRPKEATAGMEAEV